MKVITKVATKQTIKVATKAPAKVDKVETGAKQVGKPAQKAKVAAKPANVVKVGSKRQGGKTAIGKAASKLGGNVAKRLRRH